MEIYFIFDIVFIDSLMVDEDMSLIFLMLKFLLICFEDCGYLERKRRVSEDSCEVCEIIIGNLN